MRASFLTFWLVVVGASVLVAPDAASASARAAPRVSALRSLRATAAKVASRRSIDRSDLRGPAREIALTWAKIEPGFASDPDAIVETEMLNRAITSFENDWSRNLGMAPSDARKIVSAASQLLQAAEV